MGPHWLQLAAGGADDDDSLIELFYELGAIADALAPATACSWIGFDDNVRFGLPSVTDSNGASPTLVERCCDEIVIDAFPYQVLGPGHLARLGQSEAGDGPLLRSGKQLEGGRVGLRLGEPRAWLDEPTAARDAGRRHLAGCILTTNEVMDLIRQREAPDENG